MKKTFQFNILIILISSFNLISCKQEVAKEYWPEINRESKPWTRWWWMASAVDADNIKELIKEYADAGIGGLEITPIYGVKGEEDKFIDFLSPEWIDMLKETTSAAQEWQVGIDMNTGTGWPFGGPTISDRFASKKMRFRQLPEMSRDEIAAFIEKMTKDKKEDLLALSAFSSEERLNLLEEKGLSQYSNSDKKELIAVTQENTGQIVKRAAPGGEGLIFNHFSNEATDHYVKRFDEAFKGSPNIRSFFNDSYELKWANATADLFVEFKKIKNYDLALYTKELNGIGDREEVARIKSDYRDVLDILLRDNFTLVWDKWAEKHNALSRNQAHGSPANLIDLYAAVDIPEMETFHATKFPFLQSYIDQSDAKHTESNKLFKKFASSAAHQKSQKLVSCESLTWLNEHFKTPLYQCKAEIDELFIKGVNHIFFHGTAYSPKDAAWPGWLFYASIHIEPNNPQWEHMKAMNEYITRCQSILQLGQHTNDFLVFWSPDEYFHDSDTLEKKLTLHNSEEWIHMPEVDTLLEKGFQFDFTSDRIISENMEIREGTIVTFGKSKYQALVFPQLNRIKLNTFKKALQYAQQGATLIFSNMPSKVSGFKDYKKQEKELRELVESLNFSDKGAFQVAKIGRGEIYLGNLDSALKACTILRETLIDHRVKNISRKTKDGVYYFIANHEREVIDEWLRFKHSAKNAIVMNPMNGEVILADRDQNSIHIQLEPGASRIIFFTNNKVKDIQEKPRLKEGSPITLKGPWNFQSIRGGPQRLEEKILKEPQFWTNINSEEGKSFSGTCEYSTSFNVNTTETDQFLLRLEKVETSAKIYLNDKEVATLWSFPFEAEIGDFLKEGKNMLRIEVSNLGANRIRYLDKEGINWKKFYNINIVNLDYKTLEASNWPILPSGLSGKVELIPLLK